MHLTKLALQLPLLLLAIGLFVLSALAWHYALTTKFTQRVEPATDSDYAIVFALLVGAPALGVLLSVIVVNL